MFARRRGGRRERACAAASFACLAVRGGRERPADATPLRPTARKVEPPKRLVLLFGQQIRYNRNPRRSILVPEEHCEPERDRSCRRRRTHTARMTLEDLGHALLVGRSEELAQDYMNFDIRPSGMRRHFPVDLT